MEFRQFVTCRRWLSSATRTSHSAILRHKCLGTAAHYIFGAWRRPMSEIRCEARGVSTHLSPCACIRRRGHLGLPIHSRQRKKKRCAQPLGGPWLLLSRGHRKRLWLLVEGSVPATRLGQPWNFPSSRKARV